MVMNKRTQLQRGGPQLGPVLALQALLTEHPELPLLSWSLSESGFLAGNGHDVLGLDVRSALAAYVDVLGGIPTAPRSYLSNSKMVVSQHLDVVWRDIPVHISTYASISAYPELLVPLAVAA